MTSDRDWVERVLDHGDEVAFRQLFRRHTPRMLQFALRLLGGAESDAEDAVQETWIRASDKLAAFRWESALGTWLMGIVLNVCREQRKRGARFVATDLDAAEASPNGLASALPLEGPIDLGRAIEALPDGYREVLVLHDIEGYTHDEIGQRLGISAGGSKSQLSRARRAVRDALGPRTGGDA